MLRQLYKALSVLLFPVIELYLFYRVYKKKEDKYRLKERFGRASVERPDKRIIWVHAVSVGETNSAMILVEELLKTSEDIAILFTTTTLTSASIVEKKLPQFNNRLIHQFLPIDSLYCVRSFFDHWKITTAIFFESEVWPNLVFEAKKREISFFLANARMSDKSAKKWLWARRLGFNIFDYFTVIFAQTKDDKARFENLTKQEVLFYGNLKSQAKTLEYKKEELEKLQNQIGNRKIFLAASTHKKEEEIIIEAHKELKAKFSDLLTIIIPRHPVRSDEVCVLLKDYKFAKRSANEEIKTDHEVYLADSLGEIGLFYKLVDFAFIGGSLFEIGGHNPFEAIKLNTAVISGKYIFNFKDIYQDLENAQGCVIVDSKDDLVKSVSNLIENQNIKEEINKNAQEITNQSNNISKIIVKKIDNYILLDD